MQMKENQDTVGLEQRLGSLLSPVTPQKDFVNALQENLKKKAQVVIEKPNYLYIVLLILSGLFFGIFIYWLFTIFRKMFRKGV